MHRIGDPNRVMAPRIVTIGVIPQVFPRIDGLRPMRKEGIIARNDSLGRSRSGQLDGRLGEPVVAAVQIDRLSARPGRGSSSRRN